MDKSRMFFCGSDQLRSGFAIRVFVYMSSVVSLYVFLAVSQVLWGKLLLKSLKIKALELNEEKCIWAAVGRNCIYFNIPSVAAIADNYWGLKYIFQHLSHISFLFTFFYR